MTTAGMRPTLVDAGTGAVTPVELFVAVLGASNYAVATRTQQSADWIASHSEAAEYSGGVPAVWVPDQLRTGGTAPCRYEPRAAHLTRRNIEGYAARFSRPPTLSIWSNLVGDTIPSRVYTGHMGNLPSLQALQPRSARTDH